MSINSDMKLYVLEIKDSDRTDSGAVKPIWQSAGEIYAAVNKIDDLIILQSALVNEASHFALTRFKNIKEGKYRLKKDDKIYSIQKCDPQGRYTTLYLKEVDTDV